MKAFLKIVSIVVLLGALPPLAPQAAPAKPAVPSKPAVPCRLVLSLGSAGLPELTVTLVNAGPDPVKSVINSHNPSLVVEYKPLTGNPKADTGWQRMKSYAELRRKPGDHAETETYNVLIEIAPKQEYVMPLLRRLDGFPTTADGYYRITAESETSLKDTGELTLHSNSIIARRTASGFAAVSPV